MSNEVERRFTPGAVEVRAQGEKRMIGGYAIVWGKLSRNLGGFVERVDPAALNRQRGNGWGDVLARYNHDDNALLGTVAARTLILTIDKNGLDYEVDPPKTRADVTELVQRGDVRHSSFAFRDVQDEWGESDQGFPLRTLASFTLVDVAPVNSPAYPDASAGLRSLAETFDASLEEVRSLAQANELGKFFKRTDLKGRDPERVLDPVRARVELMDRATPDWAA